MPKIKSFSINGFDYLKGQWDAEVSKGVNVLIGPNGSGKTTLLDAWRSSLGLSRFGDRNLSKYIREEGIICIKFDNSPGTDGICPCQEITDEDVITVIQKFWRGSRNVERKFFILPGDFDVRKENLPMKEALGAEKFMEKMRKLGFSDAYLRILAQPQGQIWSLLTLKPYELFASLLDITGDREVMDKLNNALEKVAKAKAEHQQIELEVTKSRVSHNSLVRDFDQLNTYRDWIKEKKLNETLVKLAKLNELIRTRSGSLGVITGASKAIAKLTEELKELKQLTRQYAGKEFELEKQKNKALEQRNQADGERRIVGELITNLLVEIRQLEGELVEAEKLPQGSKTELCQKAERLQRQIERLNANLVVVREQHNELEEERKALEADQAYYSEDVRRARLELEKHGISYRQVSDVIEIVDQDWRRAIEAFLGANRFGLIIDSHDRGEILKAKRILRNMSFEKQKGYPFWIAKPKEALDLVVDPDSVLAKVTIPKDLRGYFTYLNRIKRVVTEDEAERWADDHGVESLATDGYYTSGDGRSRVLRVGGRQYCGEKARQQRKAVIQQEIFDLRKKIYDLETEAASLNIDLQSYLRSIEYIPIRESNPLKIARLRDELNRVKQMEEEAERYFREADLSFTQFYEQLLELCKQQTEHYQLVEVREQDLIKQNENKKKAEDNLKKQKEDIDRIQRELTQEEMKLQSQVQYEVKVYEDKVRDLDTKITNFKNNQETSQIIEKLDTIEMLVQNSAKRLAISEESLAKREIEIKKAQVIYQECLEDYRQHIKHIFALLEQKLQRKAGEYGIRVTLRSKLKEEGEVDKDEVDLKVAFTDKALASYQSGDLSGGQKTVISILLIMAAVQASAEINDEHAGSIDFLIFDEPAASLDSHWFEEVGLFFKKSGLQIFFTAPEDEKIKNCWWVDQGIFTAIKEPGKKYAPPLDIVKFIPSDIDAMEWNKADEAI